MQMYENMYMSMQVQRDFHAGAVAFHKSAASLWVYSPMRVSVDEANFKT